MSSNGCGYGVEVHGDLQFAVSVIEAAGIRILEVIHQ
jgi:hypothetical protein